MPFRNAQLAKVSFRTKSAVSMENIVFNQTAEKNTSQEATGMFEQKVVGLRYGQPRDWEDPKAHPEKAWVWVFPSVSLFNNPKWVTSNKAKLEDWPEVHPLPLRGNLWYHLPLLAIPSRGQLQRKAVATELGRSRSHSSSGASPDCLIGAGLGERQAAHVKAEKSSAKRFQLKYRREQESHQHFEKPTVPTRFGRCDVTSRHQLVT